MLDSDPQMADKLNNAAMGAARLWAELKEKSLGVPPPSKVSFLLDFVATTF